jgi:HAD superfamily hydrolase (TIGR01509 family)
MELGARRHWIFDMDGTLTCSVHDFDAIRGRLGLPSGTPLLEAVAAAPPAEAKRLREGITAWEWEMAERARAGPGVSALLTHLAAAGYRLGVLTRNRRDIALRTLAVTSLGHHFSADDVLGRGDAAPKPAPDGIQRLLERWRAAPSDAVMIGDYLYDLQAGRAAGVATVYIDRAHTGRWSAWADRTVRRLDALLPG